MKKILVIEDTYSLGNQIYKILSIEGFHVKTAQNGLTGLKEAKEFLPDLIICDIMLPDIDGYTVLKNIRQDPDLSAIPFIFLTSKSGRENIRYGMDVGADDYITKPFSFRELTEAVNSRLRKQEGIKAYFASLSNERLHYLLSSSPSVIYTCPPGIYKDFTYISENIASLLGYMPEEVMSSENFWTDRIHPEDRERLFFGMEENKNGTLVQEYRFLHANGTYRWLYDRRKIISTGEISGSLLDITGRKEAEDSVKELIVMEGLVTNIATRFFKTNNLEKDLEHSLKAMCHFLDVNHGFICLCSKDYLNIDRIYEWYEGEQEKSAKIFEGLTCKSLPWFLSALKSLEQIVISSVEALPYEADREKNFLKSLDIKSILCSPLTSNDMLTGCIAFISKDNEKNWSDLHKRLLYMTGDIFSTILSQPEHIKRKEEKSLFHNITGKSKEMQKIYSLIEDLSDIQTTVLISGETGTGKELVAEALHYRSIRRHNPLIKVNCSALSENLQESELFGHVKGAFTGAIKDKKGLFQKAEGGTIFLDEIGDISPGMQMKLLRVLQNKEVKPVGSENTFKVDVRVIAATNMELRKQVKEGFFREDLYYRINVVEIKLPPLRDRESDIPVLTEHFITKFNRTFKKNIKGISEEVKDFFISYHWPGNVRELEHVIEHAFIVCHDEIITLSALPPDFIKILREKNYGNTSDEDFIRNTLENNRWNIAKAARILGMSRPTLYKKMKSYGIEKNVKV